MNGNTPVKRGRGAGLTRDLGGAPVTNRPANAAAVGTEVIVPVTVKDAPFQGAKKGRKGLVETKAREPQGVTPRRNVGFEETTKITPKGYVIYDERPEWAPYMSPSRTEFRGNFKMRTANTPGDLPFLGEGREVSAPRMAIFSEVGLTNLEKLGVPRYFDEDVEITRPLDGKKVVINLVRAPTGSVSLSDALLVMEEVMRKRTFEVNADTAEAWGFKPKPGQPTMKVKGADMLKKVNALITDAERMGEEGTAHPIPRDSKASREEYLTVLRQFVINNLWHSATLTHAHQAAGHDTSKGSTLNETFNHDLIEPVPLKDLAWQLMQFRHAPWMDSWLRAELNKQAPGLADGLTNEQLYATLVMGPGYEELFAKVADADDPVNVKMSEMKQLAETDPVVKQRMAQIQKAQGGKEFLYNPNAANPHYLVGMFEWGGSREDSNTLCHPHRDSEHHDGTSVHPTNMQKRFANGAVHHAGVELPPNVRREDFMGWDGKVEGDFQRIIDEVFKKDPAFRNVVVQQGSFEMMKFERAMMQAGYMLPSHKVARPQISTYVDLNHAYNELQEINKEADNQLWRLEKQVAKALPQVRPELATAARLVSTAMAALERKDAAAPALAQVALQAFSAFGNLVDMQSALEKKLFADLGQALQSKLVQQAPATTERTATFASVAEELRTSLEAQVPDRKSLKFVPPDLMLEMRQRLEELPAAAQRARDINELALATSYEGWRLHTQSGFASTEH